MDNKNWSNYYKITKQNTLPRKTLLKAIEIFNCRNKFNCAQLAIDVGCGAGADSIELLKNNWSVLAIDSQAEAISTLISSCPQSLQNRLKTKVASFESLTSLPTSQLINASYSLPFLSSDNFYKFWKLILEALPPGGIFAGIFFGINDGWNCYKRSDMTFLSTNDLYNLFVPFKIELLEEEESDGADAMGFIKHWHRYFVVAEKC
ncbi:SAM-dependent methyltransferase [Legionella steigerwaltii]|uniref:SAM-dependent methyltransferase n=1 Tax=Legionella steigerwaltii TaxID=460 RepID=A0A378L798_9GAMM|nr:class I SAM-dependent methyltransferase [Legionella steigerwaltii]KTD77058.1 SAM-dependent methyltransferase [Legionella steigerwaltii]STY21549.1 SAM-dependent methyltransferase [Legionella steigerwaltii]